VTNAANLSLFMVNLVERLLRDVRHEQEQMSVLDLKAQYRGAKYVEETIKLLPETPDTSLLERIITKVVGIGRIHAAPADPLPA
jgi:putative transposase